MGVPLTLGAAGLLERAQAVPERALGQAHGRERRELLTSIAYLAVAQVPDPRTCPSAAAPPRPTWRGAPRPRSPKSRRPRHARVTARTADRHPQALLRDTRENGRFGVAILARWQPVDDRRVEIVGELDPAGPAGLRDGGPDEPRLTILVQVAHTRRLELADTAAGRVRHEQRETGRRA
jgi:hypothetical protein